MPTHYHHLPYGFIHEELQMPVGQDPTGSVPLNMWLQHARARCGALCLP